MPDTRHDEPTPDQALSSGGLQSALQSLLATQPELAARLATFAGETVAIEITPFATRWLVRLGNPPAVLDAATHRDPADLTLTGTPGAYLARLAYRDHSGLRVSGDLALAGRLLNLLAAARIDWHALLAPYLGEEVVSHGRRLLDSVGGWLRQGRDGFLLDAEEYLRHELQVLPTRAAHDAWLTAVETLRQDTDRLEARLERLERQLEASARIGCGKPRSPDRREAGQAAPAGGPGTTSTDRDAEQDA